MLDAILTTYELSGIVGDTPTELLEELSINETQELIDFVYRKVYESGDWTNEPLIGNKDANQLMKKLVITHSILFSKDDIKKINSR